MIKLRIACIGKLKDKHWIAAESEYLRHLRRFCDFDTVELKPEESAAEPSEGEIAAILAAEGERLKKAAAGFPVTVAMAVEGSELSSEQFSAMLKKEADVGRGVCFMIGGSWGIDEAIKKSCTYRVSMSRFTMPHRLARIVLLEQIFRAFKIMNGETYHK